MKTRIISGACFVVIVVGFFLLRQFVNPALFNILLWVFSAVGTFEMARACKSITGEAIFKISCVFGVLFVPTFVLTELFVKDGFGFVYALILTAAALVINVAIASRKEDRKALYYAFLDVLYPSVFILLMLLTNDLVLQKGFVAMLLLFVIAPFADTFAYFVGSLLKGPKLCPKLSPKKTWSGAIGGCIGGAVGAIVVFFVFATSLGGYFTWYLFLALGFITSILTIAGDLFESSIKRKLEIKDMGKIMPGHGGVLDRIDGMTFAVVLIYLVFALL